jgi:hypothetical protein
MKLSLAAKYVSARGIVEPGSEKWPALMVLPVKGICTNIYACLKVQGATSIFIPHPPLFHTPEQILKRLESGQKHGKKLPSTPAPVFSRVASSNYIASNSGIKYLLNCGISFQKQI